MAADLIKIGFGEQGQPTYIPQNILLNTTITFNDFGYNPHVSDMISLLRSVPDIRDPKCDTMKYFSRLPSVSIIIPFYNEHWSVLLRSVYSVLHRSPPELINEIILVDDFSDTDFLAGKLNDSFVGKNFLKIKIIRHKERKGLIAARLSGAKIAISEILIFLHSHVEPNYNWLPPLLEPIAYNSKIVVCPLIDTINCDTFKYHAEDNGARGAFDWGFGYNRIPLLPENVQDPTIPYLSPVMKGGLYAINRNWFWELGGYDPELVIWGGEQFELSFKIWMCGGALLEAPCSRIAHINRGYKITKNLRTDDFIYRNYKRVAEVWMDEYAQFVYDRRRSTYYIETEAGDISDRIELRKRLKCKSFDWFMKNIASDILKYYPLEEPQSYASGSVRSMANENLCLDSLNNNPFSNPEPGLYPCTSNNPIIAYGNQNWEISGYKDLKLRDSDICLDVSQHYQNGKVALFICHRGQGNQRWFYDSYHKLLKQGLSGYCLEANITNLTVYVNECNESNINMKWKFGYYNVTALNIFYKSVIMEY